MEDKIIEAEVIGQIATPTTQDDLLSVIMKIRPDAKNPHRLAEEIAKKLTKAKGHSEEYILADRAEAHIRGLLTDVIKAGRSYLAVGKYLLDTFYDGDPAKAASKNPTKFSAWRILMQRCETEALPIPRSVLYDAVRAAGVVMSLPPDSRFLALPWTHQRSLLPLGTAGKIEEAAKKLTKNPTVREVKAAVPKARQTKARKAVVKGVVSLEAAKKAIDECNIADITDKTAAVALLKGIIASADGVIAKLKKKR